MVRGQREPEEALPLSEPVYQILLSLTDSPRHGYAIIQDVGERTDGEVELTASTLYAALKRLLERGWIEELPKPDPEDARRRNYRISDAGHTLLRREAERLARSADMARAKGLLPAGDPAEGGT